MGNDAKGSVAGEPSRLTNTNGVSKYLQEMEAE